MPRNLQHAVINQLYGRYPQEHSSKRSPDVEAHPVPSQCVDAPPMTRRRRTERVARSSSAVQPTADWIALVRRAAPPPETSDLSGEALLARGAVPGLPPGVVDTRPAGLRVIDIRDGVQLHDGVLDTRPHGIEVLIDTPPSPFAADAPWAPAPQPAPEDEATADVPRIVDVSVPVPPPSDDVRIPAAERPSPYMRRSEMRRLEARAARRPPSASLSLPQVGIASALGLATIAAPLTGSLSAPLQAGANRLSTTTSNSIIAAAPAEVTAAFPQSGSAPLNAVEKVRLVVDDSRLSSVPAAIAAPGRVLATRASRGGSARAVLPDCDGVVPASAKSAGNGRLPASALCTLWNRDEKLRADAAVALAKLNVAYTQSFGHDLCITDSYRTLSEQYTVKALRGYLAAAPGTSEHGWGLAIDLCGGAGIAGTETFRWLRANATRYGWDNPDWAQSGGSGAYEPWHWEYFAGQDGPSGRD